MWDGRSIIAHAIVDTDWEPERASAAALTGALERGGLARNEIAGIAATGVNREKVDIPSTLTGINAAALGARAVHPRCMTVIDLGAEGIRSAHVEESGAVGNYAVNDKCASGAGAFLETMARILAVPATELGSLSAQRENEINIDTQCVVFAESEVISLIHQKVPAPDIVHAVHLGLANKISSIVLRVGVDEPVVMIGASAADAGLVEALESKLGVPISVPEEHEYVSAIGAAAHAAAQTGKGA